MFTTLFTFTLAVLAFHAKAETHTVKFQNNCGRGSPVLLQAGNILTNGSDYTSNGPINSAIAYLQTGECLLNGENCALVELNMNNPSCPGCGSSVDISLISPHALNVETAFAFYGGDGDTCDGLGAVCATKDCNTAFFQPNDNQVQRACQSDNVNLLITFCGGGQNEFTDAVVGSMANLDSGSDSAPVSSNNAASSSPPAQPSSSPAPAHTSDAAASTGSAVLAAAPPAVSATPGGGSSPTPSPSPSPSLTSSAASPTKTCSRKRAVRAKRAASIAKGAQYHRRAHAFTQNTF